MQAISCKKTINCGGNLFSLEKPVVMGILNLTPDSFFEGSRVGSTSELLAHAEKMLFEGAQILDLGGQSTRPGAEKLNVKLELDRVIPMLKILVKEFPNTIFSIDTFYGEVANQAIAEGAAIINDVSGAEEDEQMLAVLAKLKSPYVLMNRSLSKDLMPQKQQFENNPILEICDYFAQKIAQLRQLGLTDIILDPGFGFGKTLDQNYQILNNLDLLKIFELPILVGISRKSMIQKVTQTNAIHALNGTTALNMFSLTKGAKILRVHDVKEAVECIHIYNQLNLDNFENQIIADNR